MLDYGTKGDLEASIACAFVADAVGELATKLFGREAAWGVDPGVLDPARGFCATYRDADFLAGLAGQDGPRHLRSEEHTSELQSLMRISYAVFCLQKKKTYTHHTACPQ